MTTRRSIEVIVHPDGTLKIEALGIAGPDCAKLTAFLEHALGNVTARRQKPEYYQAATVKPKQRASV
jgi:hypothetical protein